MNCHKQRIVYKGQPFINKFYGKIENIKLLYKDTANFHTNILNNTLYPAVKHPSFINWIQPGMEPDDFKFPNGCTLLCENHEGRRWHAAGILAACDIPRSIVRMYAVIPKVDFKTITSED